MFSTLLQPLKSGAQYNKENNFFSIVNDDNHPITSFKGPGIGLVTTSSSIENGLRKNLYQLSSHFRNIDMYDLGYINDFSQRSEIIRFCNGSGVIPIFIGDHSQGESTYKNEATNWIISNKIHASCTSCNYIGYQRHLCTPDDIFHAEEYQYNHISLGKMRSIPALLEPVLRDIVHLHVEMQALRSSDAPNIKNTYASGLYAEELCQILRHCGSSGQISTVQFHFECIQNPCQKEMQLLAEAIWYFAEGVNIRIVDHPLKSNDFTNFVIHSPNIEEDLHFIKHNQTGKWWLKYDFGERTRYLACSYDEYQASVREDLPERISKFINVQTF